MTTTRSTRCGNVRAGHSCPRRATARIGLTVDGHPVTKWRTVCPDHLAEVVRTHSENDAIAEMTTVIDWLPVAPTLPRGRITRAHRFAVDA